ncbi:hypothetical protein V8C37DRAFT_106122 [Trichoderma ceciliae]
MYRGVPKTEYNKTCRLTTRLEIFSLISVILNLQLRLLAWRRCVEDRPDDVKHSSGCLSMFLATMFIDIAIFRIEAWDARPIG